MFGGSSRGNIPAVIWMIFDGIVLCVFTVNLVCWQGKAGSVLSRKTSDRSAASCRFLGSWDLRRAWGSCAIELKGRLNVVNNSWGRFLGKSSTERSSSKISRNLKGPLKTSRQWWPLLLAILPSIAMFILNLGNKGICFWVCFVGLY